MPILAAIAAVIVGAAAWTIGKQLGTDVAPLLAVVGPVVLGLVVWGALWQWHRRKMRELEQGRYDLKHDQLGWRAIVVKPHDRWYVCSDCGDPMPDLKASQTHSAWHEELAELLERLTVLLGEREQPEPEPAWSAVTEPDPEQPEQLEPAAPRPDAGQLERAEREQLERARAERDDQAADNDAGEWERRARAFRASLEQTIKAGR